MKRLNEISSTDTPLINLKTYLRKNKTKNVGIQNIFNYKWQTNGKLNPIKKKKNTIHKCMMVQSAC